MRTVVFYISGHGFGHATRDIELINAMLARRADLRVVVRTTAPRWLFELMIRLPPGASPVDVHRVETDAGIVQIDSLHLDEGETLRRARAFMAGFEERVAQEAAFLEEQRADLVIADIPPLGIAAAHRAGCPAIALGNFTWDWVYAAYAGAGDLATALAGAYATADVGWRLPMHGGFASIDTVVDLPFIARRSTRDPAETRRALELPADEPLVLVAFGGYGLKDIDLDALSRLDGYVALVSGNVPLGHLRDGLRGERRGSLLPVDEQKMNAAGIQYEDLVRAVDVVATKPGYGIIAECLANDTALLYTERGHFVEYDVLVREMPRFLRARYIDHADLFRGRWTPHLDALLAQPAPPERPPVNGADIAAEALLSGNIHAARTLAG